MAPPNVSVDPGELTAAGSTIGGYASSIRAIESPTFGAVANALPGFETAGAANESTQAVKQALTTISGRHEQLAGALKTGARTIVLCDDVAAAQLRSMGDLNEKPGA